MSLDPDLDPALQARPSRRRLAALGIAAAAVVAGMALRSGPQAPGPREVPFEAAVRIAGTAVLTIPEPMRADAVVFARGLPGGRWVIAGSGTVAVCSASGGRALFEPSPLDPAGMPAVEDDGTIHVPFPGRIETFTARGDRVGERAWDAPSHALALRGGRLAAAGLGEDGFLVHLDEPAGGRFPAGIDPEIAKRFRARADADGEGTLWAMHPARYALFGLSPDGLERRVEGPSPEYAAPRRFTGPPSPRAIRAWTERAWILETVVAGERGAAVSIRAMGRRRIELLGSEGSVAFHADGRRLVGRDEKRRLVFVPEEARGRELTLEIAEARMPGPARSPQNPRLTPERAFPPALLVFVSSRDCPACLPILAAVDSIARTHAPHGLEVRAVAGSEDPVAARIVALEAPGLRIVTDPGDRTRRRLGIAAGPALRLLDRDGTVVLALDGAEPVAAGARLRDAAARVCGCAGNARAGNARAGNAGAGNARPPPGAP